MTLVRRAATLAFVLPFLAAAAARAATVDLALVMAVDVSESVDAEEYELQHEGIARAFESPAVIAAINGGANGAIDVLVLEWSDRDKQVVTVDWTRVSRQGERRRLRRQGPGEPPQLQRAHCHRRCAARGAGGLPQSAGPGRPPRHRSFRRRHRQYRAAAATGA